jgi:hypothetical protein
MRTWKSIATRLPVSIFMLTLATALIGCGGKSNREEGLDNGLGGTTGGFVTSTTGGSTGTTGGSTSTTGGSSTTTGGFLPAVSFSFDQLSGTGSTRSSITFPDPNDPNVTPLQTDDIFKVKVTAGPGQQLSLPSGSGYSNFVANYGCVEYQVKVFGVTKSTGTLSVSDNPPPAGAGSSESGGVCMGPNGQAIWAPHSKVLDFSPQMTPGHGAPDVTVYNPRYDFYCIYWYSMYNYYASIGMLQYWANNWSTQCPLKNVFNAHNVSGTLEIQLNGTGPDA